MAQLLVRDIPDEIVAALKKRAKKHGRSAEAEHRAILQEVLKRQRGGEFWERAAKLREELAVKGYRFSDSTVLIRQDRDSR